MATTPSLLSTRSLTAAAHLVSRYMTKGTVIIGIAALAIAACVTMYFARHYVPSPFASVTSRGNTIVATLRPDVKFVVYERNSSQMFHSAVAEALELRNGDQLRLGTNLADYKIVCRTSPPPAGIVIEGRWHTHDFPQSFIKTWFVETR